jgi:hypothetical protein
MRKAAAASLVKAMRPHRYPGRVEDWRAHLQGPVACPATFALGLSPAPMITFPAPATSHAACGFPALRAPAHFVSRVMRLIGPKPLAKVTACI